MISYALVFIPFVDHICPGAIRRGSLSEGRVGSSGKRFACSRWGSSSVPLAHLCDLMMSPYTMTGYVAMRWPGEGVGLSLESNSGGMLVLARSGRVPLRHRLRPFAPAW